MGEGFPLRPDTRYNAAHMPRKHLLILPGVAVLLAACASDERDWMKVSGKYTTAEFRRDLAECSKGGKLDDACMRGRGWVDLKRPKSEEKPPDPRSTPSGISTPR